MSTETIEERILVLDGPPMVTADREHDAVQWHATTPNANPLAVELTTKQARGVARALDTIGEWRVAQMLRTAASHAEGKARDPEGGENA